MSKSIVFKAAAPARLRRSSQLRSLEQRFMFDGAAATEASHAAVVALPAPVEVRAADPSRDHGRKEAVFIDTSVKDYKQLDAQVPEGMAVIEIDGSHDGLAQIAQWAATQRGYDAIHILSHGSEGQLNLGTGLLDEHALQADATQQELAALGSMLKPDGDLLLYGCDVAAGTDGARFVADLAAATGADVAASTDATGAADRGGDWTLEAHSGQVDAQPLQVDGYHDLLTVVTLTDTDADYSSMTIVKSINGHDVTFTGGTGFGGMGMDTS